MKTRINERNIGNHKLDCSSKKGTSKLNENEIDTLLKVLNCIYDSMEKDEITNTFTDGGKIILSLSGEEMYDLFEAKRKLNK